MATRQKTKQKLRRGFKIPATSRIKSALMATSRSFLVSMVLSLLRQVPKRVKISALAKIDRQPKRGKTKRKAKSRNTRRKAKRSSRRAKTKRSKASIRAQRLRNLKKARAAKKRKSR